MEVLRDNVSERLITRREDNLRLNFSHIHLLVITFPIGTKILKYFNLDSRSTLL